MSYGENMKKLSPCQDELILSIIEKYCSVPHAVLDIGCGRGERLCALGKAYPDCRISGVDIDPEMAELSGGCADVRCCDASQLPFENECFDLALCECSLSLFRQPEKSLREAWRVLKKGGILLLGEIEAPMEADFEEAPEGESIGRIYSPKAIEKMVLEAGFVMKDYLDRKEDLATMVAQMIFDGSFCDCLGNETAKLLIKLKVGYGLWIYEKG